MNQTLNQETVTQTPTARMPSESKSLDTERVELPWECREEDHLISIQNNCYSESNRLNKQATHDKRMYALFGVPSVLLPIVIVTVNEHLVGTEYSFVISILLLMSAVCATINTFYNYSKKAQQFFEFSFKYQDLGDEIATELCKPRRHRIDCDLFLQRVCMRNGYISSQVPN
jgi:hypothetical protein